MQAMPSSIPPSTLARLLLTDPEHADAGEAFYLLGRSSDAELAERYNLIDISTRDTDTSASSSWDLVEEEEDFEEAPLPALPRGCPAFGSCGKGLAVVFDTETTALSPPIVCQLAWAVFSDGSLVGLHEYILKLPAGATVSPQARAVHGLSTADCAKRGVDAAETFARFFLDVDRAMRSGGRVVAHNCGFDVRAITKTMEAWKLTPVGPFFEPGAVFCTMKNSKHRSHLLTKNGRQKAFSNAELYEYLTSKPPKWASLHNALDDVLVTAHNYFGGIRVNLW